MTGPLGGLRARLVPRGTLRGMAFMVPATLCLIIMGTIARSVATELHAIEVVDVWTWVGGVMIFGPAMTAGLGESRSRVPVTERLAPFSRRRG